MPYVNKGLSTKICALTKKVSGSTITINNQYGDRLLDLKALITATQSGSGDPSPDNVRPINGWDSVDLSVNSVIKTINLGGTYYGGVLDVTNGVFNVTHFGFTVDENIATQLTGSGEGVRSGGFNLTSLGYPQCVSSTVISSHFSRAIPSGTEGRLTTGADNFYCSINTSRLSTPDTEGWKEWLGINKPTFVYRLQTPFDIQLTPTQVQLLKDNNTLYADSGDIEAIYKTFTP